MASIISLTGSIIATEGTLPNEPKNNEGEHNTYPVLQIADSCRGLNAVILEPEMPSPENRRHVVPEKTTTASGEKIGVSFPDVMTAWLDIHEKEIVDSIVVANIEHDLEVRKNSEAHSWIGAGL